MVFARRKSNAVGDDVPPPAPDLAGNILKLRGQVAAFLDAKVMELKNSRDGRSQSVDFLRHMLVHGETCHCRAALRVLADQSNG